MISGRRWKRATERLRGGDGPVADGEVAGDTDLSGEDDVFSDVGGAGEADLRAEQRVGTDGRSVADHDQVVDLGAGVDVGFADGGAVYGGVGLNFDVVVEDTQVSESRPGAPTSAGLS